jgi:hypothetical protein
MNAYLAAMIFQNFILQKIIEEVSSSTKGALYSLGEQT